MKGATRRISPRNSSAKGKDLRMREVREKEDRCSEIRQKAAAVADRSLAAIRLVVKQQRLEQSSSRVPILPSRHFLLRGARIICMYERAAPGTSIPSLSVTPNGRRTDGKPLRGADGSLARCGTVSDGLEMLTGC